MVREPNYERNFTHREADVPWGTQIDPGLILNTKADNEDLFCGVNRVNLCQKISRT